MTGGITVFFNHVDVYFHMQECSLIPVIDVLMVFSSYGGFSYDVYVMDVGVLCYGLIEM